jgi:hypothetical protein
MALVSLLPLVSEALAQTSKENALHRLTALFGQTNQTLLQL